MSIKHAKEQVKTIGTIIIGVSLYRCISVSVTMGFCTYW